MIIEQIMNKTVFTLTPEDSISSAISLIQEKKIRHIPITDHTQQVVGIVSDRDIRDASPSIFHMDEHIDDFNKPIHHIMKKDVTIGHPLDLVEEVAAIFYEQRISCLPIESDGKLVGIVTETDLLHTLVQLTGAHQPSSQIEIKAPNRTGVLADVANIIKNHNVNINSVLVYPDKSDSYKILVFRVQTMNPMGIISTLKHEGYSVLWPNIPGMSS